MVVRATDWERWVDLIETALPGSYRRVALHLSVKRTRVQGGVFLVGGLLPSNFNQNNNYYTYKWHVESTYFLAPAVTDNSASMKSKPIVSITFRSREQAAFVFIKLKLPKQQQTRKDEDARNYCYWPACHIIHRCQWKWIFKRHIDQEWICFYRRGFRLPSWYLCRKQQ
jgi:hypothetical protein